MANNVATSFPFPNCLVLWNPMPSSGVCLCVRVSVCVWLRLGTNSLLKLPLPGELERVTLQGKFGTVS